MTPVASPGRLHSRRCPAYLRRFLTLWVAEEPDPVYSWLDRSEGLGQVEIGTRVTGAEPQWR